MIISKRRNKRVLATTALVLISFTLYLKLDFYVQNDEENFAEDKAEVEFQASFKPWFFKYGFIRPKPAAVDNVTGKRIAKLWPEESVCDRIIDQLMFTPPEEPLRTKKIYFNRLKFFGGKLGSDSFTKSRCPVHQCTIIDNAEEADAVVFRDSVALRRTEDSLKQTWILYMLENPFHSGTALEKNSVNWTATYRTDSDIVTPYEKWVYYDSNIKIRLLTKNYARGKTKKVAWFVSNCKAKNNRLEYARELAKYIEVDIYGHCGTKNCVKGQSKCTDMLNKDYKFYLSFENGNCRDYITEKFFVNGLGNNILPIVMGAHPDDYKRVAPEHSYIHVDDFASPEDLANYLHMLDQNDDLYNSYFRWKGSGEFINTYFFCRLCAMLHDDRPSKVYQDFTSWWRGADVCRGDSWMT